MYLVASFGDKFGDSLNLVINLVINLAMNLVNHPYGDKLMEWFREEFGESLILVPILVMKLVQISHTFSDQFGDKSDEKLCDHFNVSLNLATISVTNWSTFVLIGPNQNFEHFEAEVWSRFWSSRFCGWILIRILKLMFGRYSEAEKNYVT